MVEITRRPGPSTRSDRGAATALLAAAIAGAVGGVLAVLLGVSLPAVLAPEGTTPVSQDVVNYDQ